MFPFNGMASHRGLAKLRIAGDARVMADELPSMLMDLFIRGGQAERNGDVIVLTYAGRQEADRKGSGPVNLMSR